MPGYGLEGASETPRYGAADPGAVSTSVGIRPGPKPRQPLLRDGDLIPFSMIHVFSEVRRAFPQPAFPQGVKKVAIYGVENTPDNSKLDPGTSKFESSTSGFTPEGPKKESCVIFRDFRGGQERKSKLDLGTIKFESSTSGFSPEGLEREELHHFSRFSGGSKKAG